MLRYEASIVRAEVHHIDLENAEMFFSANQQIRITKELVMPPIYAHPENQINPFNPGSFSATAQTHSYSADIPGTNHPSSSAIVAP